jgi:hypothetical protein
LPIQAATPPDGSSGNAAPALSVMQGTESNPKKHFLVASFDASTDEHLWWTFRMPANYASAPVAKLLWMTNDTTASESCVWGCQLGAVTPADTDTPVEHAQAAAQSTTTDINTTEARRLTETSIAISNADSVAAGDLCFLVVYRDANAAGDDLTSDAELITVSLDYTTS